MSSTSARDAAYERSCTAESYRRLEAYARRSATELLSTGTLDPSIVLRSEKVTTHVLRPRKILGLRIGDESVPTTQDVHRLRGWHLQSHDFLSGGNDNEDYNWSDSAILANDGSLWIREVRSNRFRGRPDPTSSDEVRPMLRGEYKLWDLRYRQESKYGGGEHSVRLVEAGYQFANHTTGLSLAIKRLRADAHLP